MIIAGPCSAESREQLFRTARALDGHIDALRVGIWKPRTHPGCFEGVGSEGLQWISDLRAELGMKVAVEVATPQHVREALDAGVDIFWIGARTTTNPFLVQQICDALKGADLPVFVKNPMNPDVELWAGAIERLQRAGITQVGAIHRGFSFYGKSRYRNIPQWQVAVDLRQRFPDITMLADPSHLTGDRKYILEAAQMAYSLDFDGLFIESHIDPDSARSDARQQLAPQQLIDLLSRLDKPDDSGDAADQAMLDSYRLRIDMIDDNIMELLSQRMEISRQIGRYKKEKHISILQQHRWEEMLARALESADKLDLDPGFVEQLFKLIHQSSIESQR